MSEKRFTLTNDYFWENQKPISSEDVCELLNKLHEEHEQLKSKNRGLKSELQIFKEDVTHSNLQINKLADENVELKKELESFKPIIFESDGKPVTLYKKGDVE